MKFTKTIESNSMKLVGRTDKTTKFARQAYELVIDGYKVDLCCIGLQYIGIDLEDGEEISIKKITIDFEK